MKFIGIDLAWKIETNPKSPRCAVTVIDEEANIIGNCIVRTDDEIAAYVMDQDDEDGIIVGIDAPLVIPAWVTKQRRCELLMGKLDLPAYPANRELFEKIFLNPRYQECFSLIR